MATITYLGMGPSTYPTTGTVAVSSAEITVSFGGYTETYFGSFSYSGGALTGGTVTGFQSNAGALAVVRMEGLSLPAVQVAATVQNGNSDTVVALLFSGSDSVWGSTYSEGIPAGDGNDTVIALDGTDTVYGGAGDDDVNGNMGQDFVFGGTGADWVRGGKDNDTIYGGDGDDPHVNGNIGNDIVYGDAGNDTLYGGQNNDSLDGGTGNDLLSGDLGDDVLHGDAGGDLFVLRAGGGIDLVLDFNAAEGDRIGMAEGTTATAGLVNGQLFYELSDGSRIVLLNVTDMSQAASWVVLV